MAARAVAPGLEMLTGAIFNALVDQLAHFSNSTSRAALNADPAATVKGVQTVAVHFRAWPYGWFQPEGGDDAAEPTVDSTLGD